MSEAEMSSPLFLFLIFLLSIVMLVWPIWVRTAW